MIDHLDAYVLTVRDLEGAILFYRDKLGLVLKTKEEDFAYLVFSNQKAPGLALSTMENAGKLISEAQIRPSEPGVHRNFLAVFVEDVDKEYRELTSKGVRFVKPPTTHPWGQRIAYFEDPEGNLWEISHFLKK